ncbi:MAG: AMP-binding protein [Butyrivibrio sp.]|nr:AMP-binding protein [Butyrivibrio sp.]
MNNLRTLWSNAAEKYADLTAVKWLDKKNICEKSYGELNDYVCKIGRGLAVAGFSGSHIAIIGETSLYWVACYLGVVTGNNVAVPLDANLPAEELVELINRSDAEALFISPKLAAVAEAAKTKCPELKNIWFMEQESSTESVNEDAENPSIRHNIFHLMGLGTIVNSYPEPQDNDLATIIFTSGTTGKSKGVMLSQKNLYDNVFNVDYQAEPGGVILSVLPIHHAYCLVMDWLKGFSLGTVICINDSFMHMMRNMNIFNPQVMLMVPLMIETIYKKIASARDIEPAKIFGTNLKTIFTGGAHLEPFYIDKFAEYGIEVLEGYGMSECSPVITSNTVNNHKPGSIGRPLDNVEIRFEDGEILVKGSSVMMGYYKMPAETAETLKDGWLHTGDKGYLDKDGYLYINGRVKNLIIMSNGENVSPEEIENKLALYPLISEVIVSGINNSLVATIYPEQELIKMNGLTDEAVKTSIQDFIDEFNSTQPTYRHITQLVLRDEPFARNSTGKIRRIPAPANQERKHAV